jgi:hypothetical protein
VTKKKSAWTDLDRVSFKKFVKESNVESKKSAWTDLGKVKKASSMAIVPYECSIWGPPKRFALWWPALDKRCSSCYTLRGFVLAEVQSHEELKMLLQAKRQPGYKMPGRVVWPSLLVHELSQMFKFGYEKLKEITRCCSGLKRDSTLWPLSMKKIPLNYQMQNFKSEMQVKDLNEQTQML